MSLMADPTQADSLAIRPLNGPVDAEIVLPGSKSITNRALVLAALAEGESTLENALFSEDSHWCVECLRGLGIRIEANEAASRFQVFGTGGKLPAPEAELFFGHYV